MTEITQVLNRFKHIKTKNCSNIFLKVTSSWMAKYKLGNTPNIADDITLILLRAYAKTKLSKPCRQKAWEDNSQEKNGQWI